VDTLALRIVLGLDVRLLAGADAAVRGGVGFGAVGVGLAVLQRSSFVVGQLAGTHTLVDALLLLDVALHVGLHALRRYGVGIAMRCVVLVAVDLPAGLVLLLLDARLFRGRQR